VNNASPSSCNGLASGIGPSSLFELFALLQQQQQQIDQQSAPNHAASFDQLFGQLLGLDRNITNGNEGGGAVGGLLPEENGQTVEMSY
jgi:hypothetical protein